MGMFDRDFIFSQTDYESSQPEYSSVFIKQMVEAKRKADEIICGDLSILDNLDFTKPEDRSIVRGMTRAAAVRCQRQISEACLELITATVGNASHTFSAGLSLTVDDIHERFPLLVRFIRTWAHILQPVEPVSNRIAMFLQKRHWEALIDISGPIAIDLLRLEYSLELRPEEALPVERELRNAYDICQRRMPEARYAVVAFLCLFLMGYRI
jgi:hypothetical protein